MAGSGPTRRQKRLKWVGDILEKAVDAEIHKRFEAPELKGRPKLRVWYRLPIPEGMSGDGSEYHIYIRRGKSRYLCVFFSGGGMAWNAYTAARPVTGGKVAAGLPNFYWNNLRPVTQLYNIHAGIMDAADPRNPFRDWNFVVIPYATGDMHIGNSDFPYTAEDGSPQILHFHGYRNFQAGMRRACAHFRDPEKLLIAGDSAGAFAVPALTTPILENFYPDCGDVTVFSDSAQLLYRKWKTTARDVWRANVAFWEPLHSSNLALDWYERLYAIWGDRVRYLYAGSPHDYLLSAYYNDLVSGKYKTDRAVQDLYERQMCGMVRALKKITPRFGIFLYGWPDLRHGGTVHTAVRHRRFYYRTPAGISMADWLGDAVKGKVDDANRDLLPGTGHMVL